MKDAPMPLLERLELAVQACHAAQLISVEKTCRDAIAALSATVTPDPEKIDLARKVLRSSTRRPVFEGHYLAAEVLRLAGVATDGKAKP